MSKKQRIRALALCVFRRDDKIFVAAGYDSVKKQTYYRPLGGGIEFGEPAHATVAREIREEIQAEVSQLKYLGTLENIFVYNSDMGHEIVLIFDGSFVDHDRNSDDYTVEGTDDGKILFTGEWKSLDYFRQGHAPLYPDGLLQLLDAQP